MFRRIGHAIFNPESFWRRVIRYGALQKYRDPVAWLEFRHLVDVECAVRRQPKSGLRQSALEDVFPEIRGRACRLLHVRPTAYSPSWEELLTISQIVAGMSPKRVFEFGTFDGRTTIHLALNTPDDALIHSLDIQTGEFEFGANARLLRRCRVGEHVFNSPWAAKVRFITGDSRANDLSNFDGTIDFVFIDADHSYEGVMNDSNRAFSMIRPGGTIVWHDYLIIDSVTKALIEIGGSRPLTNIAGTSLVVWRDIDGARAASSG